MKSKAALAAFALASNIAVGATTVTVYGYGSDRESAKQDAFNTAITNVCGKAVLNDREHRNNVTVHDATSVYTSCRIDRFDIIESNQGRIKVKVTIVDNKSSHRLFSESNHRLEFDGNQVRSQLQNIKREQQDGDRMIDEIFRDYPYRAYNIVKNNNPYVTVDENRNVLLIVPFELRWNYNFITAMNETFSQIKNNRGYGVITVMAKNPDVLLLGSKDKYYIDDITRFNYIKNKFTKDNELRLSVKAKDYKGNNVINLCYNPEYKAGGIFYSVGVYDELTVFGNDRNRGAVKIKLTMPAEVIQDISLDVVAARDCKLY